MSTAEKRNLSIGRLHLEGSDGAGGFGQQISLSGELDLYGCPELEAALAEAEASDASTIVIDMTQLEFIDSSGIAVLVAAMRRGEKSPGRLRFIPSRSADVQRLLDLCGLSQHLPTID